MFPISEPTNGLSPKKQFGQNFLVNAPMQQKISRRMQTLIALYPGVDLLEIGPGQGDLTQHFINFGRKLTLIEVDFEAVSLLENKFRGTDGLKIVHGDALKMMADQEFNPGKNFILLSNLPFNVGSRILVDLPIHHPNTPLAVILQKEVADKARIGEDFTFFGAWLNLFWNLKVEFEVAPGNFYPKPKVYSSLLVGEPKPLPEWLSTPEKRKEVRTLLKTLFRQPRKTVFNNLIHSPFAEMAAKFDDTGRLTRINWENYTEILQVCQS